MAETASGREPRSGGQPSRGGVALVSLPWRPGGGPSHELVAHASALAAAGVRVQPVDAQRVLSRALGEEALAGVLARGGLGQLLFLADIGLAGDEDVAGRLHALAVRSGADGVLTLAACRRAVARVPAALDAVVAAAGEAGVLALTDTDGALPAGLAVARRWRRAHPGGAVHLPAAPGTAGGDAGVPGPALVRDLAAPWVDEPEVEIHVSVRLDGPLGAGGGGLKPVGRLRAEVLAHMERWESGRLRIAGTERDAAAIDHVVAALQPLAAAEDLDLTVAWELGCLPSPGQARTLGEAGVVAVTLAVDDGPGPSGADPLAVLAAVRDLTARGILESWRLRPASLAGGGRTGAALADLAGCLGHLPPPAVEGPRTALGLPADEPWPLDGAGGATPGHPLVEVLRAWRAAHEPGGLVYRRGPEHLQFLDRRPVAGASRTAEREITLTGGQVEIYDFCARPRSEEEVVAHFAGRLPARSVRRLLALLAQQRLLARTRDGGVLAVACQSAYGRQVRDDDAIRTSLEAPTGPGELLPSDVELMPVLEKQ